MPRLCGVARYGVNNPYASTKEVSKTVKHGPLIKRHQAAMDSFLLSFHI